MSVERKDGYSMKSEVKDTSCGLTEDGCGGEASAVLKVGSLNASRMTVPGAK